MSETKKCNYAKELTKGFLKENPVLRLVLGTCPTLATSTSVVNGVGMGIAATIVLICSNAAISALRKVIPEKARIPAYIVIIASFVTMVQMLVKAFVPALDESLGVFLPLIVVNCIILGRAEAYASKNPVLASAVDGLGMGIGFTAALFCMGTVREILGAGTFLSGIDTMLGAYIDLGSFTGFDFTEGLSSICLVPMTIFILPAGGFFVFGMLMALANKLAESKSMKPAEFTGCDGCPNAAFCGKKNAQNAITDTTETEKTEKPEKTEEKLEAEVKAEDEVKTEDKSKPSDEETEKTPEQTGNSVEEDTQEPTEEKEAAPASDDTDNKNKENKENGSLEEKTTPPSNEKKNGGKKKKSKKNQKKDNAKAAFDTPIPETVPSFLKNASNEEAQKKEDEE